MKINFNNTEVNHFFITLIVLTFVFGFNDFSSEFVFSNWLGNLFKIFIIVSISLFAHLLGHKLAARNFGVRAEHRIWAIYSFGFRRREQFPLTIRLFRKPLYKLKSFWAGIIIPLITLLVSNGKMFLPLTESFETFKEGTKRFGMKFQKLTEYELAKIAFAGPFANLVLIFLFKMINSNNVFDFPILINAMFAVGHMLPIPGLDGAKIFFGSKSLFVFTFAFVLFYVLLIFSLSVFGAFLLSVLLSLTTGIVYYYFRVYK